MILFSTIVVSLYTFLEFLHFLGNQLVIFVSPKLENTPIKSMLNVEMDISNCQYRSFKKHIISVFCVCIC